MAGYDPKEILHRRICAAVEAIRAFPREDSDVIAYALVDAIEDFIDSKLCSCASGVGRCLVEKHQ